MSDAPVDLDRLAAWMDTRGLEAGPISDVAAITGGTQNILLSFRRGARVFVLRHPPPHKRANSDATMRREARILAALAGTDVPHPSLIAACDDVETLGAAFYLMEPVSGFNPTLGLPEPHRSDPGLQRAMGFAMADGLIALARVDPVARGIADLGRFEGWAERQVGRWRAQLDGYSELDGYPGPELPGVDEIGAWLGGPPPRRCPHGAHARRLPLRQRPHRAGRRAPRRHRRLGALDHRRPAARPRPPAGHLAGAGGRGRPDRCGGSGPPHARRGDRALLGADRPGPHRPHLVPGARVLPAGSDPGGHARGRAPASPRSRSASSSTSSR